MGAVQCLGGELRFPKRPKPIIHFGYTWEEVLQDNSIFKKAFEKDDYYQDELTYLEHTLEFLEKNMEILETKQPVDVMWIYTEAIDTLQHFQAYAKNKRIIIEGMQKIDEFIGKVWKTLQPENIIVLSDHGIGSIASMLKHEDIEVQKEAFGWRDQSVWIDNETIVGMAMNGGIISGMHDYQGTFLAAGEQIKNMQLPDMRSVDFYPTLLELCNAKIPEGREGFVLDIFEKEEYINDSRRNKKKCKKKIALIQNLDVNLFNTVINEIFLENRFAELTLYCEKKYESIFKENKRTDRVIPITQIENIELDKDNYDVIVTGYHNAYHNRIAPLVIKI